MTESDFDQIAHDLFDIATEGLNFESREVSDQIARITEQLRQVWNVRGAADTKAIQDSEDVVWGEDDAIKAIKALDR